MPPPEPQAHLTTEQKLTNLKESLNKYRAGRPALSTEVVTDMAKAVHELSDHLIALNRRLENLEENQKQWSTRGWIGPEGADT
jgi:hypothetical protein